LRHRGPDQQGVYHSKLFSLGVVRLKIIDLELGDQPMFSDDGGTVIGFNGEIFNHAELRRELEKLGHRFHSHSDTEVVLRAFMEWDKECFRHLRGMFAIALWTESQRRLLLARDRMGIKPLYVHRRGDDICFGSELKAILEHPEVERRLNLAGLNLYLLLNYVPGSHTLVHGIEKLPPGYLLEWRNGDVQLEAYWRLALKPQPRRSLESAKEELDFLLGESMREQLVSDVPSGLWVSGGIDSSTILHYAASESSNRLKTFSISFLGRSFDETPYIRQVAAQYGTEHYELDLSPTLDLQSAIEEFPYYSDEPSADAGALPVWFLSRMSRQQVKVVLSGEGADELFGGYDTYIADRLAHHLQWVPVSARRSALKLLRFWPVSDDKISFEYKLKRFLQGSLLPPDEGHLFWNGRFSESEKRAFFCAADWRPLSSLLHQLPESLNSGNHLNRYLWFDQCYYLPDDILYKVDRMSMAHSLEVRPPFLDHRIVEFAASLPEHFKIHRLRKKHVLKELMKNKVPPAVVRRKKIGFNIPAHDWLRGALRSLLLDTVTADAVEETKLFRWDRIQSLMRDHMERRANLGWHLWGLLILFLWIKRWKIQSVDAAEPQRERREDILTTN
jgi:asparagine synthase (glutamine-hydrolysing)